jgi:hypothetical protein
MVPFLRVNHSPMTEELLGIKNNCHYSKGSTKEIANDKALIAEEKKREKKKNRESMTW